MVQRASESELVRLGFSLPTARALTYAANMAEVVMLSSEDVQIVVAALQASAGADTQTMRDAQQQIEALQGQVGSLTDSLASVASQLEELRQMQTADPNLKPLLDRIEELEKKVP